MSVAGGFMPSCRSMPTIWPRCSVAWQIVVHVVNHATLHRGQWERTKLAGWLPFLYARQNEPSVRENSAGKLGL
jgi:hypothetical protein